MPWGAWIWGSDFFYRPDRVPLDIEHMASLGLNLTGVHPSWSHQIEPSEGSPGAYNNKNIALIEEMVQVAQEKGMYFMVGMRISYTSWTNHPNPYGEWAYADMLRPSYREWAIAQNDPATHPIPAYTWDVYWQRFIAAWKHLITVLDGYDNVLYFPWFYPWHGRDPQTSWWEVAEECHRHWEFTLTPDLVAQLRELTDRIIGWCPAGQGGWYTPEASRIAHDGYDAGELPLTPTSDTGRYDPDRVYPHPDKVQLDWTLDLSRMGLRNNNILYGTQGHAPINAERDDRPPYNWGNTDLQLQFIREQWIHGRKFCNRHNVPLICHEMGMFYYNTPRPVADWRMRAFNARIADLVNGTINGKYLPLYLIYFMYDDDSSTMLIDRGIRELNPMGQSIIQYQPFPEDGATPKPASMMGLQLPLSLGYLLLRRGRG